jgi:hypothetical protein
MMQLLFPTRLQKKVLADSKIHTYWTEPALAKIQLVFSQLVFFGELGDSLIHHFCTCDWRRSNSGANQERQQLFFDI